jgi:hypothetical protein
MKEQHGVDQHDHQLQQMVLLVAPFVKVHQLKLQVYLGQLEFVYLPL